MYHSKDITVLIATKDRVKQIERAILSSVNQSINPRVVVLDDASEINIKKELAYKFSKFPIKWLRSNTPSGVAGARNKLVENSSGSIMVFLDDDAYFSDEYLKGHPAQLVSQPSTDIVVVSEESKDVAWISKNDVLKKNDERSIERMLIKCEKYR